VAELCTHLDQLEIDAPPGTEGCIDCLAIGGQWVHLRRCVTCGHVGCCDQSANRHATAHFHGDAHPLIQSFEPGEDWFWCFADDLFFEIEAKAPSPSHP
jgi:Zn ribbon nucleic-acid-binding protein